MQYSVQVLRAKVRGFAAEGSSIQRMISASSGVEKQSLWTRKRQLGTEQRYHLLAYGLLRGMDYKQIESNSKSPPDAKRLLDVIKSHDRHRKVTQEGRVRYVEWTVEDVSGLLKTEVANG
jgi:23S rRNA A1618 N6-methylase RlmF